MRAWPVLLWVVFFGLSLCCSGQMDRTTNLTEGASASGSGPSRTNSIFVIRIEEDETMWVAGERLSRDDVADLSSEYNLSTNRTIEISAARNVRHKAIRSLLDSLAQQGFWKVRMSLDPGDD